MVNLNEFSSKNEVLFSKLQHYGPVTCLKIHDSYVIAGYGCVLKLFKVNGNHVELVYSQQVFDRNKIHGISVNAESNEVAISGGRSFAVGNINTLVSEKSALPKEKAVNEWITSTEFLTSGVLLILTSHNVVYKVDISSPEAKYTVNEIIHCDEKSILYSGSIRVLSPEKILVAAGTVMNGIILWDLNERKIISNLTDHEGSIFGVRVDQTGKYLISCSDDRSIKLYDLEQKKLLANGWGHGSRIWNLEFFKDTTDGLKIFSTGEDCTCRLWKYQPGQDLIQLELWENCHMGKHVWSGDIDDTFLKLCVTGGADGRVRLHDLANRGKTAIFSLNDIEAQTGFLFDKKEMIKEYTELPRLDLLLALTSSGKIFVFDHSKGQWAPLPVEKSDKLKGFGVMESFIQKNTVIVCDKTGDMLVLTFKSREINSVKMTWVENKLDVNKIVNFLTYEVKEKNVLYALVDCPNPQKPFLLVSIEISDNDELKVARKYLNKPDQNVFTTTCFIVNIEKHWLLLGSRFSSFALYDIAGEEETYEVGTVFKKICPGDTITSMYIVEQNASFLTVLITVKDGVYLFARVNLEKSFTLDIIHQNKLARGVIDGGFMLGDDLILYGFKSSYFYIWNESKQLEITNELCGGAHRKWRLLRTGTDETTYKFIHLSKTSINEKVFTARFEHQNHGLINEGTHGREIRAVSFSKVLNDDNSVYLLSGSEDTTIRLSKVDSQGKVKHFWSMNNHISGMQTVKFLDATFAASSAANEEFFIWKLDHLENGYPMMKEYYRLTPTKENPDLRIMDFDSFSVDDGFVIVLVYSDSNIKVLHFNKDKKSISLLADDYYTTCCLLNVNFVVLRDSTFIMTGATDGHLAFWDISQILSTQDNPGKKLGQVKVKQQLHQSGIKALSLEKSGSGYVIITGGDDNALMLTCLELEDDTLILEAQSFVEEAASATITSITKMGYNRVVATSVDQIVRLWSYNNNKLVCEAASYSTVADTGASDGCKIGDKYLVAISGAGLSTWSV